MVKLKETICDDALNLFNMVESHLALVWCIGWEDLSSAVAKKNKWSISLEYTKEMCQKRHKNYQTWETKSFKLKKSRCCLVKGHSCGKDIGLLPPGLKLEKTTASEVLSFFYNFKRTAQEIIRSFCKTKTRIDSLEREFKAKRTIQESLMAR